MTTVKEVYAIVLFPYLDLCTNTSPGFTKLMSIESMKIAYPDRKENTNNESSNEMIIRNALMQFGEVLVKCIQR